MDDFSADLPSAAWLFHFLVVEIGLKWGDGPSSLGRPGAYCKGYESLQAPSC